MTVNQKFSDIESVRQTLKLAMPLNQLVQLADNVYMKRTGNHCDPLEMVNDHLYKKKCDFDNHPADNDGTRDSTASFTVCPQKELFYCFGCGASGDRFEYVGHKLNLDHVESIIMVAELIGFDLTPYLEDVSEEEKIKISLFKENDIAREIAHNALLSNNRAMEYLLGRGISRESIEKFKIGYAPKLTGGKVTLFDNVANSIALQLDRKDQFNDAILFPICDTIGRMRYFQSRPFAPLPGMKYIGGNDTHPLFDDTDRIYGFDISKRELGKHKGRLVGVEGAPDAIACIQHGIPTCGFLGTVVNQKTFDLLGKYHVTELVLLLDGDKAGRDRSSKIAEKYLELKTNVRLRISMLPEGYDPDDFINKYGVDELNKIIDSAPYSIQYLVDSKWNNATTPTAKISFMNDVRPYINAVNDKIIRSIIMSDIAMKLGIDIVQVSDYYTQAAFENVGVKLYSPDGEEIILGEAIRNQEFIAELISRFGDDDWYLLRHKHLFRILKSAQYTDVESLFTIAKNMNVDNVISYKWLEYLYNKVGNVEFSLKDVEDKMIRRKAIDVMNRAKLEASDMSTDITLTIDKSTSQLYDTTYKKADNQIFDSSHQVSSAMDKIHYRMQNPGTIVGYSLGQRFRKTETAILGLQDKTLTIVAANQSVGKTQICQNWAMYQALVDRVGALWFSLEMDSDRMTYRNLSILSGVDSTSIMTGNITMDQKELIDNGAIMLDGAPFYISEIGHDLSQSLAIARKYVRSHKVKVIYVDYLQLQYISDKRTNERHRELGMISKAWKQFAKEMNVAVVGISQLSKEALMAITAEAEHGAGSYEIAQDADVYITLKEKSKEEIDQHGIDHGNLTENISKNRMGEKSVLIDLYADRAIHTIYEV